MTDAEYGALLDSPSGAENPDDKYAALLDTPTPKLTHKEMVKDTNDKMRALLVKSNAARKASHEVERKTWTPERIVAEDMSGLEQLAAGFGGGAVGMYLGIKQILGERFGTPPTDAEIREYQAAMNGLRGTGAGMAGNIASYIAPGIGTTKAISAIPAIGGLLTKGGLASAAANVGVQSAIGAGQGAIEPVVDGQDRGVNALYGLAGGAGGTAAGMGLGYSGKYMMDKFAPFFSQKAAQSAAGRMLNTAAGGDAPDVIAHLRTALPRQTAEQSAVGSNAGAKFAAMAEASRRSYPRIDSQVANRQGLLGSFAKTDDELAALTEARGKAFASQMKTASAANVDQRLVRETAVNPPTPVDYTPIQKFAGLDKKPLNVPTTEMLESLRGNPVITAAIADARRSASGLKNLDHSGLDAINKRLTPEQIVDIRKDPMKSLEGLQTMKFVLDNAIKDPTKATESLAKLGNIDMTTIRTSLMKAIDDSNPIFAQANKDFSKSSGEIFQGRLGQRLQSILSGKLEAGEKAAAFAAAIDSEKALLKKSGGFGGKDLEGQTTPENWTKIQEVLDQLKVNANVADAAKQGRSANDVRTALAGSGTELPALFNTKLTLAKSLMDKITGTGSTKAMKELSVMLDDPILTANIMESATKRQKNIMKLISHGMTTTGAIGTGWVESVK